MSTSSSASSDSDSSSSINGGSTNGGPPNLASILSSATAIMRSNSAAVPVIAAAGAPTAVRKDARSARMSYSQGAGGGSGRQPITTPLISSQPVGLRYLFMCFVSLQKRAVRTKEKDIKPYNLQYTHTGSVYHVTFYFVYRKVPPVH